MSKLEVYSDLRISRGEKLTPKLKEESTQQMQEDRSLSDKLGLIVFVSTSVALLLVLAFYFVTPNGANRAVDSSELERYTFLLPVKKKIVTSYHYVLPARFSRILVREQPEEWQDYVNQIRFVSEVIYRITKDENSLQLAQTIVEKSSQNNLDPILTTAVINAESRFKQKAVSHKGAMGLMQLMPDTAKYVSNKKELGWRGKQSLIYDAEYNVELGVTYLNHLIDTFEGNTAYSLIAYNWGPTNMNKALKNKKKVPSVSRNYSKSILTNYRKWSEEFARRQADGTSTRTIS